MTARELDDQAAPAAPLVYSVVSTASAVVLVLVGDVDLATSEELRRSLRDVIESSGAPLVVVDLSEVRFIDAAAIGVIVGGHAAAAARGRRLYVDGLQGRPARVFEILRLDWLRLPGRGHRRHGRTSRSEVRP
jgi:anti-anti-sigma factor